MAKRKPSAATHLQRQALQLMRAELQVAIDDGLARAPRRYRIIHWIATATMRVPLVGRLAEWLRKRSYEKRAKPLVTLARTTVEGRLPRRYRRALRGEAMVPSLRR